MPPSGFNNKAINGLLKFTLAVYEITNKEFKEQKEISESNYLEKYIEKLIENNHQITKTTKITIEKNAIDGLNEFVINCFSDLNDEIKIGKDKYQRPVIEGKAMEKEIEQIRNYLKNFNL